MPWSTGVYTSKDFVICAMITNLFRQHSLKHQIKFFGLEMIKTKIGIADLQTCRLADLQTLQV